MERTKGMKYGDDVDSVIDVYFFNPVSEYLSHIAYKLGMTPNEITLLSTICGIYSAYLLYKNKIREASIYFLVAYLLDCIDGRLARNYKMYSVFGEAFDFVSDMVEHFLLVIILMIRFKKQKIIILILFIIFYMCMVWHGLCEGLKTYREIGDDNFLSKKEEKFKEGNIMYKIYLLIVKLSYMNYRKLIPKYDEETIYKYLNIVKICAPGNVDMLIIALMNYNN